MALAFLSDRAWDQASIRRVSSLRTSGSREIQSREATASQACVVIPGREGRQESWAGREDAIELDLQPSSPGDSEMAVT